ncbi:MAG: DUF427 domain-containing protein [Methylotenera sp.]|jgi:uncharacterized protein (DUF427 family)|uniref:DUF427 domain-containing protein n=1 Tax=Methylotenera sp. TaxID=2051956 RepID=UPI00271AB663|nr:DUF427 domain-containing protein [Methylotenera sp.]MDO9151198.1 DUF427 domain-containing protein [Methylotenera sp.]
MKAIWNDVVIAESESTVVVEGNHYFPISAIKPEYFVETQHTTTCGWKGLANYYSIQVNGQENSNAAWVYRAPLKAAENIKNHVAFWKGVKVSS